MKKIFLKNTKGVYEVFEYTVLLDVSKELGDRNIIISNPTQIFGNNTKLGNDVTVGSNVMLGNNLTIEDGSLVKDNITIKDDVYVGKNVIINDSVIIDKKSVIGDNVLLDVGMKLGTFAKVDNGVQLQNKFLLIGSMGQLTYVGNGKICIGCISATPDEWIANGKEIANEWGYTQQQYQEYVNYVYVAKDFVDKIYIP